MKTKELSTLGITVLLFALLTGFYSCEKLCKGYCNECDPNKDEDDDPKTGLFTDPRDGQVYNTIQINKQTWLAENLNYDTQNSYCYDNLLNNCNVYGKLYYWSAAIEVCPPGWHLPTKDEWWELIMYLGDGNRFDAGGKMKEEGTAHWLEPNEGATNQSGFSALPGGYRHTDGYFRNMGRLGDWWTATEISTIDTEAWHWYLEYANDDAHTDGTLKTEALSVRCIKN